MRQQILRNRTERSCDDHHRYKFGKRSRSKGISKNTPTSRGVF